MDNRHKHIEKLINTLVVPKANEIIMKTKAPLITNVVVDTIIKSWGESDFVTILIEYKNQEGGRYVSVEELSYPISCMIVSIIPYVITGNFIIYIINTLTDNWNNKSSLRFNNHDHLESFDYYLELLKERV